MIKLIVAINRDGLIGSGSRMAWHLPREFKHFKETTMGSTLLMGRKTFEGLPKLLPGRRIVVLSTASDVQGADQVVRPEALPQLFARYRHLATETLWIAGGKSVYEQFYHEATELLVSEVSVPTMGNVFLEWDLSNYDRMVLKMDTDFVVYRYVKKG